MSFTRWLRKPKSQGRAPMRQRLSTRKRLTLEILEDRLCMSAMAIDTPLTRLDAATQARANAAYGQLPLSFEANQGQVDAQVNFLSRGSGYTLFLTPSEAVLGLKQGSSEDVLRMQLVGANSTAQVVGLDEQAGTSNYLIGNDPGQWHTSIANYGRVEYQKVYPGIDVVYYGNQRQLEYDFVVAPGADPKAIQLRFQGAQSMTLDSQGNLVLHTAGGDVIEHAPVLYQESNGVRQAVSGQYVLEGNGQVGFQVGAYDATRPLVIDPVYSLVYSTYLGGMSSDDGYGIAVDSAGNAYITGDTASRSFPTMNPFQHKLSSNWAFDAFVTKFNAAGTALVYSTFLGGNNTDEGEGIAVNAAGEAHVTGLTTSTDFPTKNAFQPTNGGNGGTLVDAFVTKLNASGSALLYSTYLGGSGRDRGHAIALDASGDAYVTGETTSANFPTVNALQSVKPSPNDGNHTDAFVAKIDPSQVGSKSLVYSTFLDGSSYSVGLGIAVDGLSNAYVTGVTGSSDFPTTPGALQTSLGGLNDGFVTKINAAGSALVYSTFLGGSGDDRAYGIALDASGNAYVTGYTASTNFSTANALQPALRGGSDAFVTKLNAAGSALIYSTYLGGSGSEEYEGGNPRGGSIAVDASGNAYVTGSTNSTDFPIANALQPTYGGAGDAFVTEFNASGSAFVYSTYLGGSSWDQTNSIAVDGSGDAYVTGTTNSSNFPTKNALQPMQGGKDYTAFVTKIDPPAASASTVMSGSTTAAAAAGTSVPTILPSAAPSVASGQLSNESSRMPQWASAPVMLPLAEPSVASGQLSNESLRMPVLASATVRTAQTIAPTSTAHVSPWEKPMTSRTALMDDVFVSGDWLAQAVVGDLPLGWIR